MKDLKPQCPKCGCDEFKAKAKMMYLYRGGNQYVQFITCVACNSAIGAFVAPEK